MPHDVRSPHIFVDGPGNTASGDQVMDNFDAVWAAVDAAKLAVLGAYSPIFQAAAGCIATGAATHVPFANGGTATIGGAAAVAPMIFHIEAAEHAVSGLTPELRIRTELSTNPTAPGVTFVTGLYPVTSLGGGAGTIGVNVGTVVPGSTSVYTNPGANSSIKANSADFVLPTDGIFIPGVAVSGAMTANAIIAITWLVERHYV